MSFVLQKRVLTLFKRNLLRHVAGSLRLQNNNFRKSDSTFSREFSLCSNKNVFSKNYFRLINSGTHSVMGHTLVSSEDEICELMAMWPDIIRDFTDVSRHDNIPHVTEWLSMVLQYNVPHGKKYRALFCMQAYRLMAPHGKLTEENLRLARILGWCIELFQAFACIIDDIQDGSKTRRNQTCWYLHNNIGFIAINDGLMLEVGTYQLLRKHFAGKDCYVNLIELFHEILFKGLMGQCVDLSSMNYEKKPNLDLFTMDRYNSIAINKTAYYTFFLPVAAAMYFAGVKDPEMHDHAKTVLLKMGHFFQVQDDYLDCYGDSSVSGEVGEDIKGGKCSWLIVVALQRATEKQRKILYECYGCDDPEKVVRVKQVYDDLDLENAYSLFAEETYNSLNTHIKQMPPGVPPELFLILLDRTYKEVNIS